MLLFLFPASVFAANPLSSADGDKVKTEKNDSKLAANAKQSWEFYSTTKDITTADISSTRNHKFGKEIGFLYDQFIQLYVRKEEVVPGDPGKRTVIHKPDIYNAVRDIEKELNRSVRKKEITLDEANECFKHILLVALATIDTESDSFEKALQQNRKDEGELIALFNSVTLRNLY